MSIARALVPFSVIFACGCSGSDACPGLAPAMTSLAAQASSLDLDIYDATSASCDGNDIAGGAPAPVSQRHIVGDATTTLQLPAGRYVVVLRAYDAAGTLLGTGCSVETFAPGQRACLGVALTAPSQGGRGNLDAGLSDGGLSQDAGLVAGPSDMAGMVPFSPQTSGTSNNLFQVWYAGNNELFVVGLKGTILHTSNGGASWQAQTSGTTQDLEAVWGSSANDVFVVGTAGTVLHSGNAGASWQKLSLGIGSGIGLWDVWGSAANDVYIVGDRGTALHGGGSSFSAVNTGTVAAINDVWGASATDVYLFGGNGYIAHGSAGAGFTKQSSGGTNTILYGWGSANGNDVWVNALNGDGTVNYILYTGNHGASWVPQLSTAATIGAMWSTAAGHAYGVGAQILETTDHGVHWTSAMLAPAQLFGVGGDPTGAMGVWTVGTSGLIMHRP